jgi:putative membrane protein
MLRMLISAVLFLVANAIGLLVAAAVLDDMSVSGEAFVIAVVIFTLVEVLVQPLLTQMAVSRASALRGSTALVATLVGLIITSLVSDGLEISGAVTWILATVIVWGAALIAGWILPLIFLKNRVEDREHEH